MCARTRRLAALLAGVLFCCGVSRPANASGSANSDPFYRALRNVGFLGDVAPVSDFTLKRDAGTFHFHSGVMCFLQPVQGKVTGAIFSGEGTFVLTPPLASEVASLSLLSKEKEFSEKFNELVLRFTDSTYDDIRKASHGTAAGSCPASALENSKNALRHNPGLKYNLDARILQDLLGKEPGGLFVAMIHGKRYSDKEIFIIDPHGVQDVVFSVAPEEVEFATYEDSKQGAWAAFHLEGEAVLGKAKGTQNNAVAHIEKQQLDTTVEKSGNMKGRATATLVSQVQGLRVIPLNLFRTLRVDSVTTDKGESLSFVQEDKNDDSNFWIILSNPLGLGQKVMLTTTYSGKEAIADEGGGNYYPVARTNWYPASPSESLGEFADYDMTFRIPKGMQIAATGGLREAKTEGDQEVSHWTNEAPQTVAGFQFGNMKVEETKMKSPEFLVQSYANLQPPDWLHGLASQGTVGTLSTLGMMKVPLSEAQIAISIYTDYFGALPFKHLAMTEQTACTYGQSWPEMVWLPICSFLDSTVRHEMGVLFGDRGYWKIVAPHEVAHQWWGHTVGFSSYRDQWMSEGFADFSASLFMQAVYSAKNPKEFLNFWNDERDLLLEKNKEGFRAIDAGALTTGYRLANSRSGFDIPRRLIYAKGAYVMHMLRMMMWDRKTGDDHFKEAMRDFVRTYSGKAATTEDFKAMMEKHMTKEMDLRGDQKLNWFFDEYVYGTALPGYKFDYSIAATGDDPVFSFKVTQSGVDDHFVMLIPIYFELPDGKVTFLGRASIHGNTAVEQKISLKGMKVIPKKALINYYADVLAAK